MTELEKIQHAKEYMDMLANGIDPIEGNALPEDTVLNNVRLSRCFFYISDILKQVIDNGGEVGRKIGIKQLSFRITDEQASQIEITESPVGISVFAKRVCAVTDGTMKRLAAVHITTWLLERGYLTENTYGGKKTKIASPKGVILGITTVDGVSAQGISYKKNLYNADAQRFLVNNLNKIADNIAAEQAKTDAQD